MIESVIGWLSSSAQRDMLVSVALVAARIVPMVALVPWLAPKGTPIIVRTSLWLALAFTFAPIAANSVTPGQMPHDMAPWLARELAIGLVFGFALSLPFYALQWAGALVDTWRGASLAEVMAPGSQGSTSPLGALYLMAGVVLFWTLGGHRLVWLAFAQTLADWPIGQAGWSMTASAGLGAARLAASALTLSVLVAAPAAACVVIVEVALGLLARATPQLPVYFAGMPLRAATGIAGALLGISIAFGEFGGAIAASIRDAVQLLGAGGP